MGGADVVEPAAPGGGVALAHAHAGRVLERVRGPRVGAVHLPAAHLARHVRAGHLDGRGQVPIAIAVDQGHRDVAPRVVAAGLTGGGPGDATRTVVQHLYETAFQNFFQFGSASAMAWVLFAVILAFSLLQFRLLRGHTEY